MGVYAKTSSEGLSISAMAGLPDGSKLYRISFTGDPESPVTAGQDAAEMLMDSGAAEILEGISNRRNQEKFTWMVPVLGTRDC